MRYAFVSDVHGNLPAWNTVLADLSVHRIDRIVCLGDTVGYGPQPAECLRSVYAHAHQMVLGNHDAVVGGRMDPAVFNDRARRVIDWTRAQLDDKAVSLFSQLPLVLVGPGFRCTHGEFTDPAAFNYVFTPADASASFRAAPEQLLFCGHTHEPCVFLVGDSGAVYKIEPQDFELEEGKRYLVNVGSVGSPRDGDPRASYVIYDEEKRGIFFHRVPFDMEAFKAAVAAAPGLSPGDVQFLRLASRHENAAVREAPDFSPARETRVTGGAKQEADIGAKLRRSNARWRLFGVLAATAAALLLGGLFFALRSAAGHAAAFPEEEPESVSAGEIGGRDGNLFPAFERVRSPAAGVGCTPPPEFHCRGYRVLLDDTRIQSAVFSPDGPVLLRSSGAESQVRFEAPAIRCRAGDQIEAFARARGEGTRNLRLVAVLRSSDGAEHTLFDNPVPESGYVGLSEKALPDAIRALSPADGWKIVRGTMPKDHPAGDGDEVRISLVGAFEGEVEVGAIAARLKSSSASR